MKPSQFLTATAVIYIAPHVHGLLAVCLAVMCLIVVVILGREGN